MKTKIFIIAFIFSQSVCSLFAQNITNTLGTGGIFKIKGTATNFFTLSQGNGNAIFLRNIEMGNVNTSSSTVGVITKNGISFLHNFAPTGSNGNTFLGVNAGNFTMINNGAGQSTGNTGIGYLSLENLTTGYLNTAVGEGSLDVNSTGYGNSALGANVLYLNTTGWGNTAIGYGTLFSNQTGNLNIAIGYSSLSSNTTGNSNTVIGTDALINSTTSSGNVAIGGNTLQSNTSGNGNTVIGLSALMNMTNGSNNTVLGSISGMTMTGGNNITLIGYNTEPSSPSVSNQITLGNNQVTSLRCNVTSITSLSDARDKKNIKDLSLGLDFIMKLKPRQFNWDKREWYDDNVSDGSKIQDTKTAGFIAQELDTVQNSENAEWLNLVMKDNPDKWEATYGNLLPVMVKAIQDLKQENDILKEQYKNQSERLTNLEQTIKSMTNSVQVVNNSNK